MWHGQECIPRSDVRSNMVGARIRNSDWEDDIDWENDLQSSSQIVETEAICLKCSPNFLHSLFTPLFSLKCAPLLRQCWATRILEHWDDCNTYINIGEGGNHTSVSRFVTSIVAKYVSRNLKRLTILCLMRKDYPMYAWSLRAWRSQREEM